MHENPTWSTAYKNQLPDSAFLYVDKRACEHTDREGRSHPLSCRHFPYRNHLGTVSLSHVRNAISRAPQSNLPASVQREVQQKARRLLDGEGRMAANSRTDSQDVAAVADDLGESAVAVLLEQRTTAPLSFTRGSDELISKRLMSHDGELSDLGYEVRERLRLFARYEHQGGSMSNNPRPSDRTWFITDGQLALVLDQRGSEQLRPLLKGGRPPSGVVLFSRPEAESEIVAWRRSGHWPLFAHKATAKNSRGTNRREGSSRRRGINDTMRSVKRNPGTSSIGPSPRRHLGKFDTPLDEAIYAASLDGFDDGSVGDATEPPFTHATLLRDGNSLAEYIDPSRARSGGIAYILNEQELDFLRTKGSAGVIVFVNSDGFVQVVYYDNAQELEKDWAETEEKLAVDDDGY